VASTHQVRKTVTVVFTDVAGSTSLGEQLDPESVRHVMARYFEEARAVLERHGGTVEKFIGDAVMAVFGIPQLHEDDALRAVRAAAEMRERLAVLNEELEAQWGARLAIRTGVNTGEVVAGDPAQGQAFATGDAVNVAARLEQAAEPGQILLGPDTFSLVRSAVRAEPVDPLELKGKAEPLPAWRLLEILTDAHDFTRGMDTPFVGRERELAALTDAFERATSERACQLITVLGPPGIGKSRLAHELLVAVGERARVVIGHCLPYGEGITYWPLAEIVKQIGGETPQPTLAELVKGDESAELIVERIADAVGFSESSARTEEIFWAVRKLIEALAQERPVIVVLDDIHWAEPTFLDLVEYVAGFSRAPTLLLCLGRPDLLELRPSWISPRPNATSVVLERLSGSESEALMEGHGQALPAPTRARIVEASEGNPLFVEQLLALQTEAGGPDGELAIPATIQALLAARIDRLRPEERTVIEPASVEGRVFHRGAVSSLLPESEREGISTQLMALVRKELITPDRSDFPGDDGFRFDHGLIRDAAYEAIPKESRADLHALFAGWLERTAGDRASEYEEILGYHLERAYRYRVELGPIHDHERDLARRAAERLAAGSRRALRRGDMPATVKLIDRALSLLPGHDRARLELLLDLGFALFALGRELDRTDAVLAEAIERAREFGDRRLEWHAIVLRSHVQMTADPERRELEQVLREAEEASAVFEEEGDDVGLARACFLLVDVYWMQGAGAKAAEAAERAVEHAGRTGSHRDVTEGLELLSWVLLDGPTPVSEGLRRCEELIEHAGGDRFAEATLLAWLATHQAMLGRFGEAREHLANATAITRDLRLPWLEAVTVLLSGYVEMLAENPVAAERDMRSAYRQFRYLGDNWWLSTVAVELPAAVYEQGRYDEAFDLTEAFGDAAAPYDLEWQIKGRAIRAKVLARRGELAEAESLAREAVSLAAQTDFPNFHGGALLDLAEVLQLAGRPGEAAAAAESAIVLYETKGNIVSARRAVALVRELQLSASP